MHIGLQTALITPEIKRLSSVKNLLRVVSSTLTAISARGTTLMNADNRVTSLLERLSDGTEMGETLARLVAARYNERRTVALQYVFNGGINAPSLYWKRSNSKNLLDSLNRVFVFEKLLRSIGDSVRLINIRKGLKLI